jgi:uncharacterized cupin superfamily protein
MDAPLISNLADLPAFARSGGPVVLVPEPLEHPWPDTGLNVRILQPGERACLYHSEPVQEDFLVLHGECLAILDEHEHRLRAWDLVHCPAGMPHVFVGAGDGPSAVLMIGSRRLDEAHYPVSAAAARHGASVEVATDDPDVAYGRDEDDDWGPVANPWPPG